MDRKCPQEDGYLHYSENCIHTIYDQVNQQRSEGHIIYIIDRNDMVNNINDRVN